jgi:hypothetical protein
MERFPVIITIGGGLLGFVAGEMLVTDPALKDWLAGLGVDFDADGKPRVGGLSLELLAGAIGAALVVGAGKWIGKRKEAAAATQQPVEVERPNS